MARLLISAAVTLLVAGMFLVLRPKFQPAGNEQENAFNQVGNSSTDSPGTTQDSSFPSRTKSKDRIVYRKPTIAETEDLLRETIIPVVDIEDLTVGETILEIRKLMKESGVEPHELQIVYDRSSLYSQWRFKGLRMRNIPLAVVLKYLCGNTKLRYRLTPGRIEFGTMDEELDGEESKAPRVSSEPEMPADNSDDPFARKPKEGPDPFAEP